jgi:hypothetical protein
MAFKSRFEEQFALLLHKLGVQFEYEVKPIPYVLQCNYFPDFYLGKGIYVETKGIFDPDDRRKHLALKTQHPDLDVRFIFYKDDRIRKKSKTKYSDWCKKHGYKYSVGLGIPEEWLRDAGYKPRKKKIDVPTKQNTKTPPNQKHKKVHRK